MKTKIIRYLILVVAIIMLALNAIDIEKRYSKQIETSDTSWHKILYRSIIKTITNP